MTQFRDALHEPKSWAFLRKIIYIPAQKFSTSWLYPVRQRVQLCQLRDLFLFFKMRNCPQQPLPEPHSKIPTAISGAAKKSALRWRSRTHRHPKVLPPARQLTSTQSSQPSNHGSTKSSGSFTIFTIIPNSTHQIITLKMALTAIPVERNLSYIFYHVY